MVQAQYGIGLDFDRDGFVCLDAASGDALNIIPRPVHLGGVYPGTFNSSQAANTLTWTRTAYGLKYIRAVTGAVTEGGIFLGADTDLSGTIGDIAVSASTQYTLVVWVRGISGYAAIDFVLRTYDQSANTIATSATFNLTAAWVQQTLTFTTGVGDTHVALGVKKNTDATAVTFDAAGFMLVAGSTAPAGFNAGAASNLEDNITRYVQRANWQNGMNDAYQRVAAPAMLTLQVDNSGQQFDQDGAGSYGSLKRATLIQVRATYSGTDYNLYFGRLRGFVATPGRYGQRVVNIEFQCPMVELLGGQYTPTLLTDTTIDPVLAEIFDKTTIVWPTTNAWWTLGVSTLGQTTLLFQNVVTSFDTGETTLAYAGDSLGSKQGVSAQQVMRDMLDAESGETRFYFDTRNEVFTFKSRHADVENVTVAASYTDDIYDGPQQMVRSLEIINRFTVHYQPREVGAAGSVIWSANDVGFILDAHDDAERSYRAQFFDPAEPNAKVAALTHLTPVPFTDYEANALADGTGKDHTRKFVEIVSDVAADSAQITIKRISGIKPVHIVTLQLRGTPLKTYDQRSVTKTNASSIGDHDLQEQNTNLPGVDSDSLAASIASWTVRYFGTDVARLPSVTSALNKATERFTAFLTRQINDRVTLAETTTDHSRDYIIVGERHDIRAGGDDTHLATWVLKPAEQIATWILGDATRSKLGTTTILGF